LLLLLSLYCIDLFSCKAASVFIINLLTYLLTYHCDDASQTVKKSGYGTKVEKVVVLVMVVVIVVVSSITAIKSQS